MYVKLPLLRGKDVQDCWQCWAIFRGVAYLIEPTSCPEIVTGLLDPSGTCSLNFRIVHEPSWKKYNLISILLPGDNADNTKMVLDWPGPEKDNWFSHTFYGPFLDVPGLSWNCSEWVRVWIFIVHVLTGKEVTGKWKRGLRGEACVATPTMHELYAYILWTVSRQSWNNW